MEIKNLGQAINLAFKLENAGVDLYMQEAEKTENETLKKMFEEFSASNQRRRKILKAIYDDNVNSDMDSGILAPIEPMEESRYLVESADEKPGVAEGISYLKALERSSESFYLDLLKRLRSSPRSLQKKIKKLAEESSHRQGRLVDDQDN